MELDPDRMLALAYVPAARRSAVEALWRLDLAFAKVLSTGRDPMISRIRLAWWREALERLDREPPPSEPVLQALATRVLPQGVRGGELAAMAEGWEVLLSPDPLGEAELRLYAEKRGRLLFHYSARLLGEETGRGGEAWALADLARHSADEDDSGSALALIAIPSGRWPRRLRPLGMLEMLAARDARRGPERWERPGAPARMLRMLGHRLTGK